MKDFADKILFILREGSLVKDTELHTFPSGSFMIDFSTETDFYCIQLFDNKFGISRITDDTGLCTIPDKTYSSWEVFQTDLSKITN